MNLLLFCQGERQGNHFLRTGLVDLVPPDGAALCLAIGDLMKRLRSQTTRPRVAVLCVHDLSTMASLVQTRRLFDDVSLVLVLPHGDAEILKQAHQLRPRYVDFLEDDGSRLSLVLERMMSKKAAL